MMSKYILSIELLSDMCVSDGGVYNSSLDMEVVYDSYGFPYIPAKRIKGCLREIALELEEIGLDVEANELFGKEGDSVGKIRVSDAHLMGVDEFHKEIKNNHSVLYHPQNVLDLYTYVRTQTSINYDNGVADDASLRSLRVVKKGNTFFSDIEIMDDSLGEGLKKCVFALRHMGISRTRGLGEVKCRLKKKDNSDLVTIFKPESGANRLYYTIDLIEPLIVKSINGGEARSLDYIEGNKVLGIIAERLKESGENITEFLQGNNIFFSNAYIADGDERMVEVPASLYAVKDDEKTIIDGAVINQNDMESRQINQIKHCYISQKSGKITKKKMVKMEDRYHHRRPEDKSIGRSIKNDENSDFYSMSSISEGQKFCGYIHGSSEQIEKIAELLSKNPKAYIGYSRMSEYGQVEIRLTKSEVFKSENKGEPVKELNIKLEAPALVYDDNAMYSTNQKVLIDEILSCLGINSNKENIIEDVRSFIKYGQIGGYNVTWGYRKPIVGVFEKGTFVKIIFKEAQYITIPENFVIGERTIEGYGEVSVASENLDKEYKIESDSDVKAISEIDVSKNKFAKDIADMLFAKYVPFYASEILKEFVQGFDKKSIEAYRPTVSNMIMMSSENTSIDELVDSVNNRYDKASDEKIVKKKRAESIIKYIVDNTKEQDNKMIKGFEDGYSIRSYSNENSQMLLLKEFLICLKYSIRAEKEEDKNE